MAYSGVFEFLTQIVSVQLLLLSPYFRSLPCQHFNWPAVNQSTRHLTMKMVARQLRFSMVHRFMNFYRNTYRKLYASAPATAFAHISAGSGIVYIDPENGLIIVARRIEGNVMNGLIEKVLRAGISK